MEYRVFKDGDAWCATGAGFVNLQESLAGFGDSPTAALSELVTNEKELRAAIANATGDDDAAPECTCAAKDMTFGRCCKVTPNVRANLTKGAADEAWNRDGAACPFGSG